MRCQKSNVAFLSGKLAVWMCDLVVGVVTPALHKLMLINVAK